MAKKLIVTIIALIGIIAMVLPGCGGGVGGTAIPYKNAGTFVEETIGMPECVDPAAAYDTSAGELISYVYEYLLMYNGTSSDEFVPVLATAWTWNETDATWTFTIRDGVHFQEGGNLTAEDVKYSFERTMIYDRAGGPEWMLFEPLCNVDDYVQLIPSPDDPPTDEQLETAFALVDSQIDVVGNDTVVFHMVGPSWQLIFLQTIANSWGAILDKEWCVANGEWNGTAADIPGHFQQADGDTHLWDNMDGTGPWKLLEYTANDWKIQRFDGYWSNPAPFDYVINTKVEEWTTRKAALLAGDADYIDVPRNYISELANITDLNVTTGLAQLVEDAFFFNFNISASSDYIGTGALDGNGIPPNFFSDLNVRQAFCYAFDYQTYLSDVMQNEAIQPGSPVVSGLYGYNPDASKYSLNLTKAKELFETSPTFGNITAVGFKFTMLYNAGNDVRKAACDILKDNLFAISHNFQVSVLPLDWKTAFLPLIRTQNAAIFQVGWAADYPHAHDFVFPFMDTQGTYSHWQSYGNSTLDAQIQAALAETDAGLQLADYYAIQEQYYQDAPGFPLSQPLGRRYFTKYIHGFYFNPMIPGNPGPLYYMSKSES